MIDWGCRQQTIETFPTFDVDAIFNASLVQSGKPYENATRIIISIIF
jgi:hypothetical protein